MQTHAQITPSLEARPAKTSLPGNVTERREAKKKKILEGLNSPATKMMVAIMATRPESMIYQGTVPAATKKANRRRNKAARRARAAGRK